MYFQTKLLHDLLVVDDTFARLHKVYPNGDLEFEFQYSISQSSAVKHDALTVNVSVMSRTIRKKTMFVDSQKGSINTKSLVSNILTQMTDTKNALKKQLEYVVVSGKSDITAKINNEIVGQLKAQVPIANISQLSKSSLKLISSLEIKTKNEIKPILVQSGHVSMENVFSEQQVVKPAALMLDMIVRKGVDPSTITNLTHRSITAIDAIDGTLRKSKIAEYAGDPATKLLNNYLFVPETQQQSITTEEIEDEVLFHVFVNEPNDEVVVPITMIIPKKQQKLLAANDAQFFVKFELVNGSTGLAIDTVTKPLNTTQHVQLFNTPRKPPILNVVKSEISSHANLEIKQIDPGATSIQLFKKTIHHATIEIEDYSLIGTYAVSNKDQSLLVQVDLPIDSTNVYRVIPVGDLGTVGYEFTNVIVKAKRFRPIKSLALVAYPIDVGMRIEARSIPKGVIAIEFLSRNLTFHNNTFANIGGDIQLIDDAIRVSDHVTIVDKTVRHGNVYEYIAKMYYKTGHIETSSSIIYEFINPEPGKVDTRLSDVQVSHSTGEPNVTFTIQTSTIDSNLDVVKTLLQKQDLYELFKGDVEKERSSLKKLIAHNVQRVDLSTGTREDFGTVTVSEFNDNALRKNQAIEPLKLGHRYRYEVSTLLRSPETLFEDFKKNNVDQTTKKNYTSTPSKFLHPITLDRGVIVTSTGLKTRYAKDQMMHGIIGAIEIVEVSFDGQPAQIINLTSSRFDRYLNIITWKVIGDVNQVDHFIIMKECNGVRTMIGKSHSEFPLGNCQYLHPLTRQDKGSFSYVVSPIFNNYETGDQVKTNTISV